MAQSRNLYELFDYFYKRNNSGEENYPFAEEMTKLFKTVGTHNITTLSMNLPDGIGDYASQVYFMEKFHHLLADCENVTLKNVSLLQEDKFKIGKIIREDKIAEDSIYVLDINENPDVMQKNINNHESIIIKTKDSVKASKNEIIQNLFLQSNFLFNVALHFQAFQSFPHGNKYSSQVCRQSEFDIFHQINSECFTESWMQYGNNDIYTRPLQSSIFSQFSMGVASHEMGIRFIDKILHLVNVEPESILPSLHNKKLLSHINKTNPDHELNVNSVSMILENNAFALGYLQNVEASLGFVRLIAATTHNKHLNVFVNMQHFKEIDNTVIEDIIKDLVLSGFTHIEFEDETGFTTMHINQNYLPQNEKFLRLCNFNGLGEADKNIWLGLAEAVSSSGDTSFSELCSTGVTNSKKPAFPFIQKLLTMPDFTAHVVKELVEYQRISHTQHPELMHYLKETDKACGMDSTFRPDYRYIPYVQNHKEKIIASWGEFCQHLYQNRNEQDHFNELIVTYTFHHLLKNDRISECINLAKKLKPDSLKNESLLHLAVKLNKVDAVEIILKEGLSKINQPHSFDKYTALNIAVHLGNIGMVKCLLHNNADLEWQDRKHRTVLECAIELKNELIVKLLIEHEEKSTQHLIQSIDNFHLKSVTSPTKNPSKIEADQQEPGTGLGKKT